jgi:hypothetical protein
MPQVFFVFGFHLKIEGISDFSYFLKHTNAEIADPGLGHCNEARLSSSGT